MTTGGVRVRSATARKRAASRSDAASSATSAASAAQLATVLEAPAERRRASRSLWAACEAFLSSGEPRRMARALDRLIEAFDCDAVAVHVRNPQGALEPWCARGAWQSPAGDLRDCVSVPLLHATDHVGTLDLKARSGRRWRPAQLAMIRTAAGALGAALGARLELERLRRVPGRDPITGLPDARAFHERFDEELARARRHGLALAVVAIDVDHFGALNARYGRGVGDDVLCETALVLKLALRESDVIARLGGDGFAVVLPETEVGPALRCADRVRRAIEEHHFPRAGHITVSAGVAASPRNGLESIELMSGAESALSLAKKSGRRRVVAASSPPSH